MSGGRAALAVRGPSGAKLSCGVVKVNVAEKAGLVV